MKLTLTIMWSNASNKYDIQVDSKQKIKTTLRVISENLLGMEDAEKCMYVRIKDTGRLINTDATYDELKIYTGTELVLIK